MIKPVLQNESLIYGNVQENVYGGKESEQDDYREQIASTTNLSDIRPGSEREKTLSVNRQIIVDNA